MKEALKNFFFEGKIFYLQVEVKMRILISGKYKLFCSLNNTRAYKNKILLYDAVLSKL